MRLYSTEPSHSSSVSRAAPQAPAVPSCPAAAAVAAGSSRRWAWAAVPAGPRPVCGAVWTAHQRDRERELRSGWLAGRNRAQKELGKEGEVFL